MNVSVGNPVGARRWWALGALSLSVLAVGLDGTVLSVALPTLAGALDASESDLQWFLSGYLLVVAAAMLPAALLGDRYGRRTVLLGSLALFGVGSAACAFAPSAGAFIAARVVLGMAGAGVIVMALASLTVLFTEEERPRAVGVWSAANFLAVPIGPIFGGWLLTHHWWGWVFLVNVPVVAVGLVAAAALVPNSRAPHPPGLDVIGIVVSTAGLVAITYGAIQAGEHGWSAAGTLVPMVAGAAALVAFLAYERRLSRHGREPLVDLGLFASRSYTWGVILVAVAVAAMIGVLFLMPQYFQGVRGADAMGSGLRLLPLIGGLVVAAVPADSIARRAGVKTAVAAGFGLLAAGLAMGAATGASSGTAFVATWMGLVGAGMGLALATASSAALAELSPDQGGVGSAVLQAVNKVGGPIGAAVLGSVLLSAYQARLDVSHLSATAAATARASIFGGVAVAHATGSASMLASARGAFVHGLDLALLVSAGFALAGLVLAVAFLPQRAGATARSDGTVGAPADTAAI